MAARRRSSSWHGARPSDRSDFGCGARRRLVEAALVRVAAELFCRRHRRRRAAHRPAARTGGAFDIDPALYGETTRHETVGLKEGRTDAELALLMAALQRDMPVLGICGGQQLLAVALGGSLIQHIPDAVPGALAHEQTTPHHRPGHDVAVLPGTRLFDLVGPAMQVNSSHHQAVRSAGRSVVNAVAPDGVIEGVEDPALKFCIGVQWHPEYGVDAGDIALFRGLVAACG
jgi:putative glutamine amidotransferase